MRSRLGDVRANASKRGVDAFLVTDIKNIRYLSGFTGSSACIIVAENAGIFLTDSRYTEVAREEARGFTVKEYSKALNLNAAVAAEVKSRGITTLGFEANHLPYETFAKLKKTLGHVRLKPLTGMVSDIRARKDAEEITLIRKSAGLLDRGFEAACAMLRSGAIEKEVAWGVESFLRRTGADAFAFEPIIASGPRGALPHGKASDKKIKKGELVVVDMGVLLNGYNSDETRTYCIGRAGLKQKKIFDAVLTAQMRAIEKIRPGAAAKDVDLAARGCIEKAGFGKHFGHGTGHGVGLDVHEAPIIGPYSKDILEDGMVVTIEPGVYIHGFGGVRIEDMVHVVRGGAEIITKTPRGLICL
ncbi:MAG: aminopeptidase P family protein [Deltaproteobacteria bacterium]|nr:aminopeptidase P family protein [Deltaproteobacteria bacterium]